MQSEPKFLAHFIAGDKKVMKTLFFMMKFNIYHFLVTDVNQFYKIKPCHLVHNE